MRFLKKSKILTDRTYGGYVHAIYERGLEKSNSRFCVQGSRRMWLGRGDAFLEGIQGKQEKADVLDKKDQLRGVNIAKNEQNDEKGVVDESD